MYSCICPWFSVEPSFCPNSFLSLLRELSNILLVSQPNRKFFSPSFLLVIILWNIVLLSHMTQVTVSSNTLYPWCPYSGSRDIGRDTLSRDVSRDDYDCRDKTVETPSHRHSRSICCRDADREGIRDTTVEIFLWRCRKNSFSKDTGRDCCPGAMVEMPPWKCRQNEFRRDTCRTVTLVVIFIETSIETSVESLSVETFV